jgi:hypothetical protein
MPGANCALYGCSTSRKSGLSLFKLPCPRVGDGQETKALKEIARKEWLHVILRTREMTPELKQRIDENTIFLCERHFKAELISDRKYRLFVFARNIVIARPLSYCVNQYG